jgi:hypothetical protein
MCSRSGRVSTGSMSFNKKDEAFSLRIFACLSETSVCIYSQRTRESLQSESR